MPRNPEEQDQFHDLDYIEMIYPEVAGMDLSTMSEDQIIEEMQLRYSDTIRTQYEAIGWEVLRSKDVNRAVMDEILHVSHILYEHSRKD